MRIEKDLLGEIAIEDDAYYGIHSYRARKNFPYYSQFPIEWYKSIGLIKLAYYLTYKDFIELAKDKIDVIKKSNIYIEPVILNAMIDSAKEISNGLYFDNFIVPAIQGGAGTSINMNVNEIIANVSLSKLNYPKGNYSIIDPIEKCNIFQSTNDVIPTSLKLTLMRLFNQLEQSINTLRKELELLENNYRNVLRIAYTQMQAAVPSSFGRLFSAYNEALSRDWWRISKCFERLKLTNICGSAVGTCINVPKYFVMNIARKIQELSGLPITRSENLHDATSNLDSLVETHSIIKSLAVNLEKITNDIRILSSDINGQKILNIPNLQAGSSIMPGKINPVIIEYTITISNIVYSNDQLITNLCAEGCLDLNAFIPIIGIKYIESLELLINLCDTLKINLFSKITIDEDKAEHYFYNNPMIATVLNTYIGYHNVEKLIEKMKKNNLNIFEANKELKLIEHNKLIDLLKIENLLKEGYSIKDLEFYIEKK